MLNISNKSATVNDERYVLEQAPTVVTGSTLVPLRFVSEALGAATVWHGDTQTVEIKKPEPTSTQPMYGFTLHVPESWKKAIKVQSNSSITEVLSKQPLTGGHKYTYYFDMFGEDGLKIGFFTVNVSRQTETEWKADVRHKYETFIKSNGGFTLSYSPSVTTVNDFKKEAEDPRSGGMLLTPEQLKQAV